MSKRYTSTRPISVLFEDDHYIAFFKPAGLLTVPTDRGPGPVPTLDALVNDQFRRRPENQDPKKQAGDALKLHPCHRIDKETSGVVVFAKGHTSQEALMDLFRNKAVHKKYIAFVHGQMEYSKGEIDTPIPEHRPGGKTETKEALTQYKVLEQKKRYAMVEVYPLTGRTNQIRIHFKDIGHPLVGESRFIYRKDFSLKFKRVALHASEVTFEHPVTKEKVEIYAPLSTDMKNFLERNRQ